MEKRSSVLASLIIVNGRLYLYVHAIFMGFRMYPRVKLVCLIRIQRNRKGLFDEPGRKELVEELPSKIWCATVRSF